MQFLLEFVGGLYHSEHDDAGSCHHGRNGIREQIRPGSLAQHLDNFAASGGKTAYSSAKSFT